jgi:radical SAM protein with 4Fe4S-binding SPASM domain
MKTLFKENDYEIAEEIITLRPRKFFIIYPDVMHEKMSAYSMPFSEFLHIVNEHFRFQTVETIFCSGFLPDVEHYPVLSEKRCPAGTTKLGLFPDGSVYPCNLFFGIEDFFLGNILYDSFEKIWNNPRLDFFRVFKRNICPKYSCEIHSSCHGGCPVHSLIHYGSLCRPEPRCTMWSRRVRTSFKG